MDDSSPSPRVRLRPWQFGLSTLFLVMTLAAVVSWWFAREEPWDQFRPRFTAKIEQYGGEIVWEQGGPTKGMFDGVRGFSSQVLRDEKPSPECACVRNRVGDTAIKDGGQLSPRRRVV